MSDGPVYVAVSLVVIGVGLVFGFLHNAGTIELNSQNASCIVLPEDSKEAAEKLSDYYDNQREVSFIVESVDGLILCFSPDHNGEATKVFR